MFSTPDFVPKSKSTGILALILFIVLIPVTIAYKSKQLVFLSERLPSFYPSPYWIHSHFILFLLSALVLIGAWLLLRGFKIAMSQARTRKLLGQHTMALFILAVVHLLFANFVSPNAWKHPIASLNQGESGYLALASPLHKATYAEAKRFEVGNFEHSVWGGFPHALNQDSPLISLLTIAFDLPVIDVQCYLSLLQKLFFVLLVIASFGFYLFVFHGLKLSPGVALLGGALYVLGNPYASNIFTQHFPIFSGPFLLLPYSLLLIWLAIERQRLFLNLLAGLGLALNFYILQPHPDAVIQAAVFLSANLLLVALSRRVSLLVILKSVALMAIGIFLGSAYGVGALVEALATHEASILGHQERLIFPYGWEWGLKALTVKHLSSFFLYLPFLVWGAAKFFRRPNGEKLSLIPDHWVVLLLATLSFVCLVGGNQGPLEYLLRFFGIHASFVFTSRVLTYYALSLLMCLCCGMQLFLDSVAISKKNTLRVMGAVVIALTAVVFIQKWPVLSVYFYSVLLVLFLFCAFTWIYQRFQFAPLLPVFCFTGFVLAQCSLLGWTDPGAHGEEPYIRLRTLLMKSRLFPEDKTASEKVITKRLSAYATRTGAILNDSAKTIWDQAELWADKIDGFYQRESVRSSYPDWMLYFEGLPRFSWIMNNIHEPNGDRFKETYMAGIGEGLLTHNFSQDPDLRMMVAYPSLNALYAYPGHYFDNAGEGYNTPSQFTIKERVLNHALTRQLFNIGGMDYYTFSPESVIQDPEKQDLQIISTPSGAISVPQQPKLFLVKDLRSYGMAYLAKEIHIVSDGINDLDSYMPPFAKKPKEVFSKYKSTVDKLHGLLLGLKRKHSIYLESSKQNSSPIGEPGGTYAGGTGNTVRIAGISGNKAAFEVHCTQKPCQLVFNHAALRNWAAYEDQTSLPIARANFAFLSVNVSLGDHLVWFEYRPWGRILGAYFTLVCFLCVFCQLLTYQRAQLARITLPGDLTSPADGLLPHPC